MIDLPALLHRATYNVLEISLLGLNVPRRVVGQAWLLEFVHLTDLLGTSHVLQSQNILSDLVFQLGLRLDGCVIRRYARPITIRV